jgi:hypothetical protein
MVAAAAAAAAAAAFELTQQHHLPDALLWAVTAAAAAAKRDSNLCVQLCCPHSHKVADLGPLHSQTAAAAAAAVAAVAVAAAAAACRLCTPYTHIFQHVLTPSETGACIASPAPAGAVCTAAGTELVLHALLPCAHVHCRCIAQVSWNAVVHKVCTGTVCVAASCELHCPNSLTAHFLCPVQYALLLLHWNAAVPRELAPTVLLLAVHYTACPAFLLCLVQNALPLVN